MGACTFVTYSFGKDVKDAFNNAVKDALYEQGHDSYNGTISTTTLKEELIDVPRYGTKKYDKYTNEILDDETRLTKYECVGIEIKGKYAKKYREQNGLKRKRGKVYIFFGIAAC